MVWDPYNDPVNKIILQGQASPGLADVAGAGTPRNWEERKSYGMGGAVLWYTGLGLAGFDVTFRFYSAQDWLDWHAWKPIVQRPPFGRLPKSLDIYHPLLDDLGIKSVVVQDVLQAMQESDGVWVRTIKFKEWRRLKLSLSKPEASDDTIKPKTANEREIERLSGEAQSQRAALIDNARGLGLVP